MKALNTAALLLLAACTTTQTQESIPHTYDLSATARAVVPSQVLVEASLKQQDGEVVILPRVIMLADREASIFVGDVSDDGCENGIHGQFEVQGDLVIATMRVIEDGVDRWSEEQSIPIEPAEEETIALPAGFVWPGFCGIGEQHAVSDQE